MFDHNLIIKRKKRLQHSNNFKFARSGMDILNLINNNRYRIELMNFIFEIEDNNYIHFSLGRI